LQQCDATPRTLLGELTALPRPLAWSFGRGKKGERRRKIKGRERKGGKGKESEREKEERKGEGDNGKGGRRKEKRKKEEKRRVKRKGGILCSCDFSLGKTLTAILSP